MGKGDCSNRNDSMKCMVFNFVFLIKFTLIHFSLPITHKSNPIQLPQCHDIYDFVVLFSLDRADLSLIVTFHYFVSSVATINDNTFKKFSA
ncbi:hypothetical protein BGP_6159 [Beggiatoa sp. PS]|nr:hypothetical protein BGP_6159 [Beggiatoa sp. PS]